MEDRIQPARRPGARLVDDEILIRTRAALVERLLLVLLAAALVGAVSLQFGVVVSGAFGTVSTAFAAATGG